MIQDSSLMIIPIIMGLVSAARKAGLPSKFLPLLSIFLGMVGGFVFISPEEPKRALLEGIITGLSAVGLWSGTKNTWQKRQ